MGKIDYSRLEEITVKSQGELDAIPDDFAGSPAGRMRGIRKDSGRKEKT